MADLNHLRTARDQRSQNLVRLFVSLRRHAVSFFIVVVLCVTTRLVFAVDPADAEQPANLVEDLLPEVDRIEFVTTYLKAIENGDHSQVNDLIDWSEIVDIATAGENSPALNRQRKEFKVGFVTAVTKPASGSFTDVIIQNVKNGGSFTFLRFAKFENQIVAVFRMKNANQGMNYHRYFLKRSKDGLVRANDIHFLTLAERVSDSVRRTWLPVVENSTKSFWDKLLKPADPVLASLNPLKEMTRLNREGKPELALEIYQKLPEKVQAQKLLLLARLNAAQHVSLEQYEAGIEDFRRFHPDDASLDFYLIDGYALKKEYDKCLKCIDRTEQALGGDSWLVSLRGSILAQAGRFAEATAAADAAITMEPDFKDLHFNALAIAIQTKNNEDIAKHLTTIEDIFGIEIGDLKEIPDYADFVESPEYEEWMESRK